jgi:hypothetical protein
MSAPVSSPPPPDPTFLATSNFTSTVILNKIFDLLLNMISILQNAAAAQANRLQFMSEWQSAYTDAQNQIHTFIQENASPETTAFASNSSSDATTRDDLNRLNTGFTNTLQNRQSIVSDDAKALQSNINQSNDAVTQQSDLGTAILQELSTLLQVLFQSPP